MFLTEIITVCSYSIVQHHFGLKYSFPGVRSQDEKSWKFHVCGGVGGYFLELHIIQTGERQPNWLF